jgi:hypothetical protein
MGYTTEFTGFVTIEPPLNRHEVAYINRFADSRRFARHSGPYQVEGGNYRDSDTIEYNQAAPGQPGLWCDWTVSDDGTAIGWDGTEKFSHSVEWMRYLIDTFLSPTAVLRTELASRVDGRYYAADFHFFTFDHVLNGTIDAAGEDPTDRWRLTVRDNVVERVDGGTTSGEAITTNLPPEPANKSFAVWFDHTGDPYAVFYRDDHYGSESDDPTERWSNADVYGADDIESITWSELCSDLDGFDGPHALTLVRSESPAVKP